MSPQGWLPIADYSAKYKVSISTLRRRIKSGEIEYDFQDGKYFLRDVLPVKLQPTPTMTHKISATVAPPPPLDGGRVVGEIKTVGLQSELQFAKLEIDESRVLATTHRLLHELKQAYSLILKEKEDLVVQLKGELADLRTLTKVLETENERLRNSSLTSWMEK